jgi:hypothetical protein
MAEDNNIGVAQTDDDFDDNTTSTQPPAPADADKKFTQADMDRVIADRVAREKAKYSDYGDLKKRAAAAMTDNEKALADAEQRGRSAALQGAGVRLARAELRAAAAGKVSESALAGFLEYADMSKFVGEDGEPNEKAIAAAVKKIGGDKPTGSDTTFDGGARGNAAKPNDMNTLIRRSAGLA